MAYETAVLKQLGAHTAKHLSRMGGFSPHIRLTDYRAHRIFQPCVLRLETT